jgi:hypothetical protein
MTAPVCQVAGGLNGSGLMARSRGVIPHAIPGVRSLILRPLPDDPVIVGRSCDRLPRRALGWERRQSSLQRLWVVPDLR